MQFPKRLYCEWTEGQPRAAHSSFGGSMETEDHSIGKLQQGEKRQSSACHFTGQPQSGIEIYSTTNSLRTKD